MKRETCEKLIIANWKMNPATLKEAEELSDSFKKGIKDAKNVEVVLCPPFVYLEPLSKSFKFHVSGFKLGAQNVFWRESGAYTGEISPLMLKNLGIEYAIVGHSERRQYLNETDEMIAKKIKAVLENGLTPILCVGETLEQRKKRQAQNIVREQLEKDLKYVLGSKFQAPSAIVAYEPIWAIGTGNYCQPADALEMIKFIKQVLNSKFQISNSKVLYGGSVGAQNIADFLKYSEIDGALVGGASLKSVEFQKLFDAVSQTIKG